MKQITVKITETGQEPRTVGSQWEKVGEEERAASIARMDDAIAEYCR